MKTILIGAGAAGLFFAGLYKKDLLILDKNDQAGRKLLATGNGRCNFTNLNLSDDFYFSSNEGFYSYALRTNDNKDLIVYLNSLGILTTNLPSGRCYPQTLSSKTVRDILFMRANGKFIFEEDVLDIDFEKKLVITKDAKYAYDRLVIASGGKSLPGSGSDGKIFKILKKVHSLRDFSYAITNYKCQNPLSKRAKGVRVTAKASLYIDGKFINSSTDDVIFQPYGLTGTAILDLSNQISYGLFKNSDIRVQLDLLSAYDFKEVLDILSALAGKYKDMTLRELLTGFINEKLIFDLVKNTGLREDIKAKSLSSKDLKKITASLKGLEFRIKEINDVENAQVTIGGIDTKFVNPKTFESKNIKDLYFIGEVLDVDGACGGYNIQWAYSSAKACADYLNKN